MKIGLLGHGVVGSGVRKIIDDGATWEVRELAVKRILVKDESELTDPRCTLNFDEILNDPEIEIVAECMGGLEPAHTFAKKALEKGKYVVTSNKKMLATYCEDLFETAVRNGVTVHYEASCGGGIPWMAALDRTRRVDDIDSFRGIFNGTTNYILTRMEKSGISFEDALKEAQQKGYAERNPAADVEGHDACRKIAILSSLICGRTVRYEDIPCEGISRITTADFGYARSMKRAIKLLGVSRKGEDGSLSVRTAPFLVREDHPLHSVQDVFNGVFVHGNMVDDLMFYGRGAGKYPTASAVVSDVMECARNLGRNVGCKWCGEIEKIADPMKETYQYFVRVSKEEAQAAQEAFGAVCKAEFDGAPQDEAAFVTALMTEESFAQAAKAFKSLKQCIRLLQD